MEFKNFDMLIQAVHGLDSCRRMDLAGAEDIHALQAALQAADEKLCIPLLIGKPARIQAGLDALGRGGDGFQIIDAAGDNPGLTAVHCVRDGQADFLMKGGIQSRDLLSPLVDRANGLSSGKLMTSVAIAQIPNYPKLIVNVDGGMVIAPDLVQKKQILCSTVELLHRMGYAKPKIAVLCGIETVNPKMQETVDAAALAEMNRCGQLPGCLVAGPISYDLVFSQEAARIKGFDCPWCGDFDVVLSPSLAAGNILTKAWAYSAGAKWAGVIAGARIPVVLTSRGSSAEEKYLSIALAALTSGV